MNGSLGTAPTSAPIVGSSILPPNGCRIVGGGDAAARAEDG
jgi:hypothetical protein